MRLSAAVILIALALAGCASTPVVTGAPTATRGAAPEPMGGRWQLSAPGLSQCVMNLGGSAGDSEGTIAPEGGCPGNFYTSRKWSYELGSLVIRDHNGQPLAQLGREAPGRFEGKATNGQPVTLTR
jgi:hypothetical protein